MNELLEKAEKLGIEIPHISWKEIDRDIRPVLTKMEKVGVKLDIEAFKSLSSKLEKKIAELETEIHKLAGREFNIASPTQMSEVLFTDLKLPTKDIKRIKTGISTSASELKKLEDKHPVVKLILEYREIAKLISTYLKPMPLLVDENSRLHTHYGLETATSRLTSSEPNLQNIPIRGTFGPEIRRAFVAEKGMKLVCADYSQIELRIAAVLAQDEVMLDAFKKGEDIHTRVASEVFEVVADKVDKSQRRIAKIVNFGILYGVSPYGLSQQTGLPHDKCLQLITKYFEVHKGIKKYIDETSRMARDEGYVETLFGFKRELTNIHSTNRYLVEADERIATNTPIQGTAAEVLKLAMIELDKILKTVCHSRAGGNPDNNEFTPPNLPLKGRGGSEPEDDTIRGDDSKDIPRIIMTVHDEIVVEAPQDLAKEVAELMEKVMVSVIKLPIPLEVNVGVGDNWDEAK